MTAKINGDVDVVVQRVTALLARMGESEASLVVEQAVRAAGQNALAQSILLLNAAVGDNAALIQSADVARVDGDQVLTDRLDTMSARVGDAEAAARQEVQTRAAADGTLTAGLADSLALSRTLGGDTAAAGASALTALLTGDAARRTDSAALAAARDELTAKINGDIDVVVQRVTALLARMGASEASAIAEQVRHVRFKFDGAVAEKGDEARWHLGFIAQEIKAAFDAKGIDAMMIGLLCHDSWEEESEPEYEMVTRSENQPICVPSSLIGPKGEPLSSWVDNMVDVTESVPTGRTIIRRPAGDRWGLRYEQCAVIDGAWQRREMLAQHAQIATLQAQIAALQAA